MALAFFAPSAARADDYTGQQIQGITRQSVNVLRLYHLTLEQQLQADRYSYTLGYVAHWTPEHFVVNTGEAVHGLLARQQIVAGIGFGHPRDGVGGYLGVAGDGAYVIGDGIRAHMWDVLVHGGVAYKGFQLSAGFRDTTGWSGLDLNGNFTRFGGGGAVGPPFRAGTPAATTGTYGSAALSPQDLPSHYDYFFELHHVSGLSLGALLSREVDAYTGQLLEATGLSALTSLYRPVDLFGEKVGVPFIGFDRLAGALDYYFDRFQRPLPEVPGEPVAPPTPSPTGGDIYQIPIGFDDIAGLGLGTRTTVQASPKPLFRTVEANARLDVPLNKDREGSMSFRIGARALALRRADAYSFASEEFAGFVGTYSVGDNPVPVSMLFTHSYNTPDAVSFFPIPFVHVLGVELVFGAPAPTQQRADTYWKKAREEK
jgi:hypothetical protein